MSENKLPLSSFSIGGYRSFGDKVQRFGKLSRINLFIGQNNCGKSNILRFLHDIYPGSAKAISLTALDRHIPISANFITGISVSLCKNDQGQTPEFTSEFSPKIIQDQYHQNRLKLIFEVFQEKARLDGTVDNLWFDFDVNKSLINNNWDAAFKVINDPNLMSIWNGMTNQTGGSRNQHWYPETLKRLTPTFTPINVKMIPAIRQVGKQGSVSEEYSGEGIIERLAKLQNPDVLSQNNREKFKRINEFLQNVIDNNTASIEIPYERNTILVHIDGKALPLESLGTGIHEVIILAAAATILENAVICMEEPELHLNPILQKKLMRYLLDATTNQYFITTHSAALMDTPSAEVYHIKMEDGQSIVERVTSDKHRSEICEDLGYHPSDLLQSNCVIWVEGPSDRTYINYWIRSLSPNFIEGIHYSIMFYGGRLASHLSGEDIDNSIENFISLRRLNRRGVIVIDSDKENMEAQINATKKRLQVQFDSGPGYAWITEGRAMENYLNPVNIKTAKQIVHPETQCNDTFGQFEHTLSITTKLGKVAQASKVGIAKYIVDNFVDDFSQLDLKKQVQKLVDFIKESNPSVAITSN